MPECWGTINNQTCKMCRRNWSNLIGHYCYNHEAQGLSDVPGYCFAAEIDEYVQASFAIKCWHNG